MAQETTFQTRLTMIELKRQGLTHSEISQRLGLSISCIKKFWRRFVKEGQRGLRHISHRPRKRHPNQTPQPLREVILGVKKEHPNWGAQFIQGQLHRLKARYIPHRRTIERFLNRFPELPKRRYHKHTPLQDSGRARRLHQLWQIDFKVNYTFKVKGTLGGKKFSFLNMRDMASTITIMIYTLPQGRSSLTSQEVISVCRLAFTKWGHLPEAIRTDHGSCFCAPEHDSFPTDFTLYLWALGINHELIPVRCPARNGGIERDQRTLSENFLSGYQYRSQTKLGLDAQEFGEFRNLFVPSRSVRCKGKTALEVASELDCRAALFKPQQERKLFNPRRIYDRLAQLSWQRTVDSSGYINVGHYKYYVGRAYCRQQVRLHFDPIGLELVACTPQRGEVKRWQIRGISYEEIVKDQWSNKNIELPRRSRKRAA